MEIYIIKVGQKGLALLHKCVPFQQKSEQRLKKTETVYSGVKGGFETISPYFHPRLFSTSTKRRQLSSPPGTNVKRVPGTKNFAAFAGLCRCVQVCASL
jgi:hypothetical protein